MGVSVQDFGQVTHLLITNLKEAIKSSPRYVANHFPFEVSGLMPDVARKDATSILNLNLLHVGRDPFYRNTPVQTVRSQPNSSQPLSLNLSYLLTSFSEKNWHMEQYLMSVALQYFHANPIYVGPSFEFTITVQADSIEEMSRLWQATTVPLRLSSLFRVAIVFLDPAKQPIADSRAPVEFALSVGPDLNLPSPSPLPPPRLFELAMQVVMRVPPDAADASKLTVVPGQPAVVAGQTLRLRGSGLQQADASAVFLSPAGGGAEWPLPSNWTLTDPKASGALNAADEIAVVLDPNSKYAAAPASHTAFASAPLPGAYSIAVGNPGSAFRSNALSLLIGPVMEGVTAAQPVLQPDASQTYTFNANGLIAGQTQVLLDQTAFTIAATAGPGQAAITVQTASLPGSISFQLPASGLVSKTYMQVRLIVNSVEAPPAWWIQVP